MTDFEKERTAAEKLAEANHTVPGPAAVSGEAVEVDLLHDAPPSGAL